MNRREVAAPLLIGYLDGLKKGRIFFKIFYIMNFIFWEMICLQHFYNIFTTNLKWQVVIGYYC